LLDSLARPKADESPRDDAQVSPTDYQNTLNELNTVLANAHNPYKSLLDNTLAILTLYLSPYVLGSHYERVSPAVAPLPGAALILSCSRRRR
jgi:hypothetical protein